MMGLTIIGRLECTQTTKNQPRSRQGKPKFFYPERLKPIVFGIEEGTLKARHAMNGQQLVFKRVQRNKINRLSFPFGHNQTSFDHKTGSIRRRRTNHLSEGINHRHLVVGGKTIASFCLAKGRIKANSRNQ